MIQGARSGDPLAEDRFGTPAERDELRLVGAITKRSAGHEEPGPLTPTTARLR